MRKIKKLLIILLLGIYAAGCSVQTKKLKVAVIVKSTTSQFFTSVSLGANAASKEYNIDLSFMGPSSEENYQAQIQMVEQAIADQMDAIVLSAIDYNKLAEPVEQAAAAGIPVIIVDSDVHSDKVSARISTNNLEAGSMAGAAIKEQKKQEIVLGIVNFDVNTANGQEREFGVRTALLNDSKVRGIYTINVPSNVDDAIKGTKQLLKEHPDINTLVTFNEWTTLGVGYAIKAEQLSDQIAVVGFDNNLVSVGMLETGEVDALIVQTPFAIGYLGVEQAQNIINRRGEQQAVTYTKTICVTKENMFDKEIQKILFPFD